jgi:SpoVK/Ycf46/Vps4 family AAA+-type ATPase
MKLTASAQPGKLRLVIQVGGEKLATMQLSSLCSASTSIEAGFVLMAATNLDSRSALIREGQFDLKIRVDLPDEQVAKDLESLFQESRRK